MNGGKWKIAEIGRAEIEEYLYVSFIPQKINYFDTYSVEKKITIEKHKQPPCAK